MFSLRFAFVGRVGLFHKPATVSMLVSGMLGDTSALSERGDKAFVHYYHPPVGSDEVWKMVRGSPFKNVVMIITNRKALSTQ